MAKYGPSDLIISVDDSGDSPVTVTAFIDSQTAVEIEAIIEESHSFGKSWVEHLFTGIKRMSELTFEGFYDDAAANFDAIFIGIGGTRTVLLTWGSSKTTSFEVIITKYVRTTGRNASTRATATLMPTGTVTEA